MNNSLKILEWANKNKKPIIINMGKGNLSDEEIKEKLIWDDNLKTYVGEEIGIWNLKLLYEIARGEVENFKIEMSD